MKTPKRPGRKTQPSEPVIEKRALHESGKSRDLNSDNLVYVLKVQLSIRKKKTRLCDRFKNPSTQLVFSALTIEQKGNLTIISFSLLSMNAFHSRLCSVKRRTFITLKILKLCADMFPMRPPSIKNGTILTTN